MPADVTHVAVLDRTRPKNFGQGVLSALEGAATGEAIGMDREGAQAAVYGVVERLRESPRFEVVVPLVDKEEFPSDIFDRSLTRDQVREICRRSGTQALVSLEAFDSDSVVTLGSHTETETDANGRERNFLVHDALRETSVLSAWRLYLADRGGIQDEIRDVRNADSWSNPGRTPDAAIAGLASPYETSRIVGRVAGVDYGVRIAPTWITVVREYYTSGDARMKDAKRYALASDWEGAKSIWTELAESNDRKLRGKALFNIAVAEEVGGCLKCAIAKAKKASVALGNGLSRNYVRTLERRLQDKRRLRQQMEVSKPAPVHPGDRVEEPLAIPAGPGRVERPR